MCVSGVGSNPNCNVRGSWPAHSCIHAYTVYTPDWWKRQVLHQLWPSGSQHTNKKECRQDIHSGFETHEEGHMKSKTGAISGSTKWTLIQTKKKKKKVQIVIILTSTHSRARVAHYGIQHHACHTDGCGFTAPGNSHQCLWTCLQVLELKRLGCHVHLHTISRCQTRGES